MKEELDIKALAERMGDKTVSLYQSYEREDDEHGCFEIEYTSAEVDKNGDILLYYDVIVTDHEHHSTYKEHEWYSFEDAPLEEQIDIYKDIMEETERKVAMRAVVLLPGNGKIEFVDFECEPENVEMELLLHYGYSNFQYMACPVSAWYCKHKYISASGECEIVKEVIV